LDISPDVFKFKKWMPEQPRKIPFPASFSDRKTALNKFRDNGIHEIKRVSVGCFLTDHYNSLNPGINRAPVDGKASLFPNRVATSFNQIHFAGAGTVRG